MRKKLLFGIASFVALLALATGSASARDCFIANRSATGNQQAGTNSKVWTIVTLSDFLQEDLGFPPACASGAVAAVQAAGLPIQFTTRSDKTIGEGSANPNLANSKGLEHLEESPISGASVGAAFAFAAANPQLCS